MFHCITWIMGQDKGLDRVWAHGNFSLLGSQIPLFLITVMIGSKRLGRLEYSYPLFFYFNKIQKKNTVIIFRIRANPLFF